MSKENFQEFIKKPWIIGTAGIILGLILGLVVGWGIWPVQWTDASAENLRPDLQRDFLRNAVIAYEKTSDQTKAMQMFQELGEYADLTLSEITTDLGFVTTEQVLKFSQAVSAETAVIEQPVPEKPLEDEATKIKPSTLIGLVLLLLLVGSGLLVYFFFLRSKSGLKRKPITDEIPDKRLFEESEVKTIEKVTPGNDKPVAQYMTNYMFGDDQYDESFTFDAPNGEFLGECGVSIGDTIGVGEPKKISAFEIWLFDKNDVQTVTKVFLSDHFFNETNLRQRLESKGELISAEPGKQILLETATLQLEARIVDMHYGEMPLPENSYFQRFTLELTIWRK